jgi:hypothetical protein
MIHKPQSKSKMRDAAFKKEILRLQRQIYTQEAKIARLESELILRPPFEVPKTYRDVTVDDVNKYLKKMRASGKKGGTNAA